MDMKSHWTHSGNFCSSGQTKYTFAERFFKYCDSKGVFFLSITIDESYTEIDSSPDLAVRLEAVETIGTRTSN